MNTTVEKDLRRDIAEYECGGVPSAMTMIGAGRIENWRAEVRRRGKVFVMVIQGQFYKHPALPDGGMNETGAVIWMDRKLRFCRTTTNVYVLGERAADGV